MKLKSIIVCASMFIFVQMVIFTTLFWRCPTLPKSTLKMTMLFRRCLTLLKSTLKSTTLIRRCSTLIWRRATLRRHINQKTTLKQSWNVCWESYRWTKDNYFRCERRSFLLVCWHSWNFESSLAEKDVRDAMQNFLGTVACTKVQGSSRRQKDCIFQPMDKKLDEWVWS